MLSLEEMKKIRIKKGISYEDIARKSGVSVSSVQKLFGGTASNPRRSTLEKLSKAFQDDKIYKYNNKVKPGGEIHEPDIRYNIYGSGKNVSGGSASLYSRSGYTYEDYLSLELPEGKRIEIIDGVIYDIAVPSNTHQAILGYLHVFLSNELRKRKRKCLAFMAPFDVRLDFGEGPTTVVQPDLVVKCSDDVEFDEEGREKPWVPRFVIEILSKSTRTKDLYIKTKKYREAGVYEYWMIDNKMKNVIKHNFRSETVEVFGYNDKIPVDVFDGDIRIDMKALEVYLTEYADVIGINK